MIKQLQRRLLSVATIRIDGAETFAKSVCDTSFSTRTVLILFSFIDYPFEIFGYKVM